MERGRERHREIAREMEPERDGERDRERKKKGGGGALSVSFKRDCLWVGDSR